MLCLYFVHSSFLSHHASTPFRRFASESCDPGISLVLPVAKRQVKHLLSDCLPMCCHPPQRTTFRFDIYDFGAHHSSSKEMTQIRSNSHHLLAALYGLNYFVRSDQWLIPDGPITCYGSRIEFSLSVSPYILRGMALWCNATCNLGVRVRWVTVRWG